MTERTRCRRTRSSSTRWWAGAAALLALAAQGCVVSPPIAAIAAAPGVEVFQVVTPDYNPLRVSPNDRYAILMNGQRFLPAGDGLPVWSADDLLRGPREEDPWVDGDMEQATRLLLAKGYDVYRIDFGQVTPDVLLGLLDQLSYVCTPDTELFLAYSGEGDSKGLRTRTLTIERGTNLVVPGTTITPPDLFGALSALKGRKAVLINACESGIFAEAARGHPDQVDVVIAACPVGTATTPHEPSGTTAIFAAFLELYEDDPAAVLNLAEVEIDEAGGFWTNLAHHWQHFWTFGGSKPLSYEPVIAVNGDFWF